MLPSWATSPFLAPLVPPYQLKVYSAANGLETFDNNAPLGLREVTLEAVMLPAQEAKVR